MAMTDAQVNEMVRKLLIAFGVETTDDLVKEMVNRFLGWKLPKDFAPDAGISFTAPKHYEDGDEYEPLWWPVGTNLLTADQAREMVQHMLGLSNVLADRPAALHAAGPESEANGVERRGRHHG